MTEQAPIHAEIRDWLACHECGKVQPLVLLDDTREAHCERCGHLLYIDRPQWLDRATALAITATILFVISNTFPFLALEIGGFRQDATIISGVGALIEREQWLLAALVVVTIFLMPLLEILALLYTLLPYRLRWPLPRQMLVFRSLVIAQPWSMLEIFSLAVLVSVVKLGDMASIVPGAAMYAFFALVATLIATYVTMDRRHIWGWLYPNNYFVGKRDEPMFNCGVCDALVGRSLIHTRRRCPRCRSPLHERAPRSYQKTLALVLAAVVLYVPANILPIMSYTSFGYTRDNTIFTGIVDLISEGMWGIAMVVFIASIVVPIAKLVVLSYLLWSVKSGIGAGAPHQSVLYRTIDLIGRWSMVDVFVVTLLVALVQFGILGHVEPGGALLAFGGVVILTMLATQTFDPRLLWDAQKKRHASLSDT